MSETIFGYQKDQYFMHEALMQARCAQQEGEVPIGAVLVDEHGVIIATAYNKTEALHSQQAHAEMRVMAEACQKRDDWRLQDCWLYVTLEPCLMCVGCMLLSRLKGVVYAAPSPLFGSFSYLDKMALSSVYKMNMPIVLSGVCEDEAAMLLKRFFKEKREL